MNDTVVVFLFNNAVVRTDQNAADYVGREDVLINPDIPMGTRPHTWKIDNGKIGFLSPSDLAIREAGLGRSVDGISKPWTGIPQDKQAHLERAMFPISSPVIKKERAQIDWPLWISIASAISLTGVSILYALHKL